MSSRSVCFKESKRLFRHKKKYRSGSVPTRETVLMRKGWGRGPRDGSGPVRDPLEIQS